MATSKTSTHVGQDYIVGITSLSRYGTEIGGVTISVKKDSDIFTYIENTRDVVDALLGIAAQLELAVEDILEETVRGAG